MMNKFFILLVLVQIEWISCSLKLNILMPDVSPQNPDTYLCYKQKLNEESPIYITEFQPHSKKEIAHHILLYGCAEPGTTEDVWDCGEMHSSSNGNAQQYINGPVCKGAKQSIIYAWAMDAPKLVLPKDVAFKIGGNTHIKYLVMQVHYANVELFKNGKTDESGIVLIGQNEPVKHVAGVYLLGTAGFMKANTKEKFETACEMNENLDIVPFAYRTHAHKLGKVNSAYLVRTDPLSSKQEWIELGRRSPQLPQMFYPVSNNVTIGKGDILAARCTMENTKNRDVFIGSTGDDEMCNVYIMYYTSGDKVLNTNMCFTSGPPYWYFEKFQDQYGNRLDMSRIPKEASQVPNGQTNEMSNMHGNQHERMNQKQSENQEQNGSVSNEDDLETDLDEMEREYVLNKLVQKYLKQLKQN